MEIDYQRKYEKYKHKYTQLKNLQMGGSTQAITNLSGILVKWNTEKQTLTNEIEQHKKTLEGKTLPNDVKQELNNIYSLLIKMNQSANMLAINNEINQLLPEFAKLAIKPGVPI